MSHAIVLQDTNEGHVGFMLTSFEPAPSGTGTYTGTCVFVILPEDPALLESELVKTLPPNQPKKEYRLSLTIRDSSHFYRLETLGKQTVLFDITPGKHGAIDVVTAKGEKKRIGITFYAKDTQKDKSSVRSEPRR